MERRHDIDWLRVIAIGLLLVYHIAIGFQSWGVMIGFVTTDHPWDSLWIPMTMLNVWRIPLLFFVSGMGIYFAMQRRNWKELIIERSRRIFVPFLFGMFCIVPISNWMWRWDNHFPQSYSPYPGHLWFLGNIMTYVVILSPFFFWLKKNENGTAANFIRKLFGSPAGIMVVIASFAAETLIVKPFPFELYAMTVHGFVLGFLAFFFGYCFVMTGRPFLEMSKRWKWVFFTVAMGLYLYRLILFQTKAPGYLLATESICWILAVLAFGNRYLNRSGCVLSYLSKAAYPVYILHMIFLTLGSILIFQIPTPAPVQFFLILMFTLTGCVLSYEGIRRVKYVRQLFGIIE